MQKRVAVVGGGAAGMMAAIVAARCGCKVTLYEKNEKLGKKLFITGKGRCNVTNACETEQLFTKIVTNRKFLYSAIYQFTNDMTIEFFENLGVPLKIERGDRVFPKSDKSSDIIRALEKELRRLQVDCRFCCTIQSIITEHGKAIGVRHRQGTEEFQAVLITTGGMSYESTGSTGDGYIFARNLGHTVRKPVPALVPLEVYEWEQAKAMQGLSLKNVNVTFYQNKKKIYEEFGEMLFTHFGVSGPIVLSASSYLPNELKSSTIDMEIDLKPALTLEMLEKRLTKDFSENKNVMFKNSLGRLLPQKMIPIIVERSGIEPEKQVNSISREERKQCATVIKKMGFRITAKRSFSEAIITKGGIDVKQINPSTMESKLVSGLFFAGEVLDLDAMTGGYNLQIAWSTGHLAGEQIAE